MKINNKEQIFIAEIKTQSPFGFKSKYSFCQLMETAINFGDWISVHDNALWGGDFNSISFVRKYTNKPILAKGFHTTEDDVKKALDHGANYVLTVDNFFNSDVTHDYKNKIIYEISNFSNDEYNEWFKKYDYLDLKVVYNGRNLQNGLPRFYIGNYMNYRKQHKWLCGASLIQNINDVNRWYPDCNAFIVGEHLMNFCKEIYEKQKIK